MAAITVITTIGKNKMLKARAGMEPLPPISGMAFGDGGLGWVPSGSENQLMHELIRKPIESIQEITDTRFRYLSTLGQSELIDKNINELALYDSDGDLIVIKTFSNKGKDEDVELAFEIDDIF